MKDLFPQALFTILGIPIQDTVLSTWVMLILLTTIVYVLGKKRPAALELLVEFVLDNVSSVMGRPADQYLPLLGTLAVFIASANVLGAVPILISPTKGINTPFALALIVFFSVHYFPIPLIAFSMLTGLLQAYIFTVLAAVYIGAAIAASESIPSEKRS